MELPRRALATVSLFLLGCAGLRVTPIKSAQQRPSNVAVYFKVQTSGGEPVGGLAADSFRIFEDGQLVSQYESKQTIVNPEVAAAHYTLLLVDMSGSVSESGNGDVVAQAVGAFTERVEKQQRVAIYAFDGSPDLYPIAGFTDQVGSAKAGVHQLATFKPRDPSTNLHGAIVKALDELDRALARATQPLKFGTLVVFTDGTDRANRVSGDEMRQRVRDKPFDVFAIGLGAEIKESELRQIGKNGTAMASDRNAVVKAFDEIGERIAARTKSYYLLSYCSPSRAGAHTVKVEAVYRDPEGGAEKTGDFQANFDATGFAPGCDPSSPPSFDVTKGDALAPPAERASKREGRSDRDGQKELKKEVRASARVGSPPPPKLPPAPPPPAGAPASSSPEPKGSSDFNP
ncbi:MAG: VWA domain-containing protein [Myxococcales bacterium]|nr:VWA domain-containing protein [Myxococcales bacterium]